MSELRAISQIMKQYKADSKAWENVCDWLGSAMPITEDKINKCKTAENYLRNVYPAAKRAADAIHVMSTVPVFALVHTKGGQKEQFVSLTNNDINIPSFVPLFFSEKQAMSEIGNIQTEGVAVECLCLPFFLFVDTGYGVFAETNPPTTMALCDPRPGKPWMFFDKQEIVELMLDAAAALRSNFVGDVIHAIAEQVASMDVFDPDDEGEAQVSDDNSLILPANDKLPIS